MPSIRVCTNLSNSPRRSDARWNFLCMLSNTLILQNIEQRMKNVHITKQLHTRSAIESFFGKPITVITPEIMPGISGANTLEKKNYCKICSQRSEKTRRKILFFSFVRNVQTPYANSTQKLIMFIFVALQRLHNKT